MERIIHYAGLAHKNAPIFNCINEMYTYERRGLKARTSIETELDDIGIL